MSLLQIIGNLGLRLASKTIWMRPFPLIALDGCGSSHNSGLMDALWFAVPKKMVSRQKKRLKTTVQNRIPLRSDIIVDPRTGQVSLKHKLPFNWTDYLPTP
jgi:ribosomal protein L32